MKKTRRGDRVPSHIEHVLTLLREDKELDEELSRLREESAEADRKLSEEESGRRITLRRF